MAEANVKESLMQSIILLKNAMRCPTGQRETKCYEINFSIDATWYKQTMKKHISQIFRCSGDKQLQTKKKVITGQTPKILITLSMELKSGLECTIYR